jgi:hypothetical protein
MNDNQEFGIPSLDVVGCKQCQSLFHEEKDCPRTQTGEPKFQFQSRKEMGLTQGSLPFKFRVEINPDLDDETEIIRKRALLRLNSAKVYNLMGISIKAHESQKATLLWLTRLADELDIDDPAMQTERGKLIPLIQTLQATLQEIYNIRQEKVQQAETMEKVAIRAHKQARKARHHAANKKTKTQTPLVLRLPDSNVDIPVDPNNMGNPLELLKEVSNAILTKEKDKHTEE